MTGAVWGLALGKRLNNLLFGLRMAAAAAGAVLLVPLIIVLLTQSPQAFEPLVLAANALFWVWVFWNARGVETSAG